MPVYVEVRLLVGLLVGLLAGVVACVGVWTLCPTVHWLDGGELTTAAWQLVAAHPPGEAGWLPLAHLLARLPLGSVPFRMGLLSVVTVALAAGLFWYLVEGLLRVKGETPSRAARALWLAVSLAPFCSFSVWIQAVRVEVYGLSLCLTLGMLVLAVQAGLCEPLESRNVLDVRRLWCAALVGGLGLAVHPLLVGLAGLPLVGLLVLDRRAWRLAIWGGALVAGGLGLSALLLVPLRARAVPDLGWGDGSSWHGLLDILLARTFQRNFGPTDLTMLLSNGQGVLEAFGPGLLGLAGLGILTLGGRSLRAVRLGQGGGASAGRTLFLVSGLILGNLASVLTQNVVIQDNPDLHGYLSLTHVLGWLLAGVALSEGLCWLERRVQAGGLASRRLVLGAPVGAVLALVLPLLPLVWPAVNRSEDMLARQHGLAALEGLSLGARLVVSGNDTSFLLQYLQEVEGRRPDVQVLPRAMLTHPWYRLRRGIDASLVQAAISGRGLREASAPYAVRVELREAELSQVTPSGPAAFCPAEPLGWGFYEVGPCRWEPLEPPRRLAGGLLSLPGAARGPQALGVGWLAADVWVKYLRARGFQRQAQVEAQAMQEALQNVWEAFREPR